MGPDLRHPSRRTPPRRSTSRSPSPDPELVRFLNEQKRPCSPDSEAFRNKRIAAAGVFNVKSRHQREKEEAEKKRLEEEERAARAYEDFVRDMQGDDRSSRNPRRGAFVRAGSSSTYESASASKSTNPPVAPRAMRGTPGATSSQAMGVDDDDVSFIKQDLTGKRKGAMGDFLGELQRNQAQREERLRAKVSEGNSISTLLAQETGGSSKPWDSSDPASTNVCVLGLPANVTETIFGEHFAPYGDIASVKIMWPRSADDLIAPSLRATRTAGATGFVNFMRRDDAERAYKAIEGSEWNGNILRTGWGKALRKPLVPLFRQSARQHGAIDSHAAGQNNGERRTRSSRSPGSRNHRRSRDTYPSTDERLRRIVTAQVDGENTVQRISSLATQVRSHGRAFEEMTMQKEANNPNYSFLRYSDAAEHQLYRLLIDDGYNAVIPEEPFEDDGDASLWSSDTEEDSEWEQLRLADRGKVLGKAARRRLEAMLRGITLRRERIARVMIFAIDHAAAAETVSNIIIDSLLQPNTPLTRKLARLYVVSDILHNSSVSASNAWRYRSLFEAKLDKVFLHWNEVANSFPGRMKRQSCRDMVRAILDVWDNWLVYENAKLATWRAYVERDSGIARKAADAADDIVVSMHDIDGEERSH